MLAVVLGSLEVIDPGYLGILKIICLKLIHFFSASENIFH
jgi:hypothetical protein